MATKSTSKRKRAPARRKTPKKAAPRSRGVTPEQCRLEDLPEEAAGVARRVESEGGLRSRSTRWSVGRS
jgi:hypothetical protein